MECHKLASGGGSRLGSPALTGASVRHSIEATNRLDRRRNQPEVAGLSLPRSSRRALADTRRKVLLIETPEMAGTMTTSPRAERATAERLVKGQSLAVRDDVQHVVGSLAALAKNGDIDQSQSSAAERWYRDYVMGVIGARDPEMRRSGKAPDLHASMLARTAAVGRCRVVRSGLGLCGEIRLKLLLIDELSFSAIAAKLFAGDINGRKKVAAQMAFLLEQLAELYMSMDQRSKPDAA